MNDWRYLSLRDLEQNEFFPKVNLKVLLYLNVNYGLVTCHVTKKIKIKEIGELVANLLYFCLNPIGCSPFHPLRNLHKVELFSVFILHLDGISSWKCS